MSVSVPTMSSACSLQSLPRSLLGYEGSLVVGSASATSPHHPAWGCAPMTQVKQEPTDHDSSSTSGVSSMAHGSFLSSNTSPSASSASSGSTAGSPGPGPLQALQALHGMSQSTPVAAQRISPSPAPVCSPRSPQPRSPHDAHPAQNKPLPRTPGSVDDNSRSSSCSNSEDDAEEAMRRGQSLGAGPFQCQLCNFTTDSREKLGEHLSSHYDLKCSLCEFSAGSADVLRSHLHDTHDLALSPDQEDHADDGFLDDQDDSVSTPKVNSQGKVKTFRCKQCDFVAVTKLDFWEHTKLHIKTEKLLTCPKCPFVTEYKHHLEYHLRNHFNSKPFKCDKCSYSCVNKSMLNSHLKSHSNVYQYRCADCTYATKYCHSLKLHLRKYGHQPSMVLNPDGTPNPLPIIDVYGTRRGPKTKTSKAAQAALQQQQQQHQQQQQPQQPHPQQPQMPFPHGIFPAPYGLPPIFPYAPHPAGFSVKEELAMSQAVPQPLQPQPLPQQPRQGSPQLQRCTYCEFTTADAELLAQHVFVHTENNLMQYFQANNNNNNYNGQDGIKEYLSKVIAAPAGPAQASPPRQATPPRQPSPVHPSPASPPRVPPATAAPQESTPRPAGTPLDLSKPESLADDAGATPGQTKNRRKGRAFKLERIAMRLQQQSSGDEADEVPAKVSRTEQTTSSATRSPSPPKSPATSVSGKDETYNCSYCDIAFRDIVMYTMHMGYHGYQDPFQCNMCGQQTTDKVSFFLHIARSSHS